MCLKQRRGAGPSERKLTLLSYFPFEITVVERNFRTTNGRFLLPDV